MNRPPTVALIAAALAAAAGGLLFGMLSRHDEPPAIAGFVYPEPKAVSPFALTAQDGGTFDLGALKGKWSFVYFGYTYCPDVCPTTLAELSRAQQLLEEDGVDSGNQYVFVSIDSRRDTPQRLAQYVKFFNPKFIGATGSDAALAGLARDVGVAFSFPGGRTGSVYPVDHSSIVALFDPDARLHAVFTPPQKAEEMAAGFRRILRSGSG